MKVVLASGSPRRRELLAMMRVEFEVIPSDFDESLVNSTELEEVVEELAWQKARKVAEKVGRREDEPVVVLGGDTLVEVEGEILGKAESRQELMGMMRKLSGKRHRVVTGVAVVNSWSGEARVASEESGVTFRELSEELIEAYSRRQVWRGKAGGYAIQEDPLGLVEGFEGNLSNIVGLPLGLTKSLLEEMGVVVEVGEVKWLEDDLVKKLKDGGR